MGGTKMLLPQTHVTDAYGERAQTLLQPLQAAFATLARDVTEKFYRIISEQATTSEIIGRLNPEEFARLKQRQVQYLVMLMSDELTHHAHLGEARNIGRLHAFVDVEIRWLVEAYSFFQEEIYKVLLARIKDAETRELLLRVIAQRFLHDIEIQASSYKDTATQITTASSRIDQEVMSTDNLTDLIRGALEIIGSLPGDVAVFFARVDSAGILQIEQSFGKSAEAYHQAMEAGDAPKISIDPNAHAGQGPGGRAWRSGEITISNSWTIESDKQPWLKVGEALGFRSSAAVPLLDESGRTNALLNLYGTLPGYFSTESIQGFLSHLQQVLSHGVQQRINAPVIPLREQQAYRRLLAERRVTLNYQPVINLRDGTLVKIEALARLSDCNGNLIYPQKFLPALGHDELHALFELGMEQICRDLRWLQSQSIDTNVAINLPAEGLGDTRYERSFFNALRKSNLTPQHFQVEILETQDAGERTALHKKFISRLKNAGVQIAQDDLGSGHSSLLRLDQYPFDEVKIDQSLVRGALHNPKRAVEFILYLTRLAHAFNTRVTVEGLENAGMIEAAAILGADYGQGYGIAKPMPLERLVTWHENYAYTVNPAEPKTAIGAMAGYMLWDLQLATISERPELAADFVGAKAIVEEFIKTNKLLQSPLDQLLARNHQMMASKDHRSEDAAKIRAQLLQELTTYWLNELES